MTETELERIIHQAAHEGAKEALKEIGLSDEEAYDDVKELRGLQILGELLKLQWGKQ